MIKIVWNLALASFSVSAGLAIVAIHRYCLEDNYTGAAMMTGLLVFDLLAINYWIKTTTMR